jgi:amino acid adenylation domain-containing protein
MAATSPTICGLFAKSAAEHADRTALVCAGRRITYCQLDEASNAVARQLRRLGVAKGELVGLVADRSAEAVAAILGILRAGAAYLPFDTSYPVNLSRDIFNDSRPWATIVQRTLGDGVTRFWAGLCYSIGPTLDLTGDEDSREFGGSPGQAARGDANSLGDDVQTLLSSEDLAYVMYTSGSTGRPKGVMIPHRGVVRLVSDCSFVDLGPDEVILHLAPLSFDASTFAIWGALLNGGRLAIIPAPHPSLNDIAEAIASYHVTTLWLTAGLFNLIVERRLDALKLLRQLLVGGDALSPPHIEKALVALPDCRIVNGYGPTENTTFTCCYTIPREQTRAGSIPIGSPIRATTVYILDDKMRPVADGEAGELYAGGAGVARGYLNRPELTAEKFVANPFDPTGESRLYGTGDRVRRRPDGNLEFIGRLDRQVKINGKRVELDGIEASLRRVAAVCDAAVIAAVKEGGRRALLAFVTLAEGHAATVAELRDDLRAELPDYMIPAEITILDELPLSPTGKVDRGKLSGTHRVAHPAARPSLPAHRTPERLTEIWCNTLGLQSVGADDNFFDLGGTSLQLLEAHDEIVTAFGTSVSLVDLFEYPNIRELAAKIDGNQVKRQPLFTAADRGRLRNAALARVRPRPSSTGAP